MSFMSFTRTRERNVNAKGTGLAIGSQAVSQLALKGLGPDAGDPFRFSWHNTRIGAEVWVEHRGSWRPAIVASRGRKYVEVEIEGAGERQRRVSKSYSELRRRR